MALDDDQLAYLRRQVGSTPDDDSLQDIYDRLDASGYDEDEDHLDAVALEVLETRLADLLANPSVMEIEGVYSQSTAANIRALQEQIDDRGGGAGASRLRFTQPTRRFAR